MSTLSTSSLQRQGRALVTGLLLGVGLILVPLPSLGGPGFYGTVHSDRPIAPGIRGVQMTFVGITDEGGPVWKRATTNARGQYAVDLPRGKYVVRAEHPEYEEYYSAEEAWVVRRPLPERRDLTLRRRHVTLVFVVRHAEKASAGADPPLRPEGVQRAQRLANTLAKARLSAIYTTPTIRTRQTAEPTAAAFGLTPIEYWEPAPLALDILQNHRGQRVLVVGHSDTIQPIVQALGASGNECVVTGDEYDNLCLVMILSEGRARGANLQYGSPSP